MRRYVSDDTAETSDGGVARRSVIRAGLVTAAAVVAPFSDAKRGAAAPTYDPEQRFVRLVGGGNGVLYAIQADGMLLWYRHLGWRDGTARWANGGTGRVIGSGWQQFRVTLAGYDGQILAVRGNGDVLWYQYRLTDTVTGAGSWHPDSGTVVGAGFHKYPRIFGGPDGMLYAVDGNGALFAYRYRGGPDGGWDHPSGLRIGAGFQRFADLAADDGGVIYGMAFGAVHWWRHLGGGTWAGGGDARKVGVFGDAARKGLIVGGGGVIYLVRPDIGTPAHDDTLGWFRLANYQTVHSDGRGEWTDGRFTVIGSGFTVEPMAAMQGYANTPSLRVGETARIAISTTFPTLTTSVVRLAPSNGPAIVVLPPRQTPGTLQKLPADYRTKGCGWRDTLTLPIPVTWPSGVYAVRVEGPHGLRRHIPFVVRPARPAAPFAVLIPTNTYHAYNDWGGHDQYSTDLPATRRTFSFRRPSRITDVDPTGMVNHTLYSDLLLLRWMTRQEIRYDCYTDADLDASADWLHEYQALVLATHSAYWSPAMRTHALDYVASGGKLIATGGNGGYERVEFTADRSALTFRTDDGARDTWGSRGLPESQLLAVSYTSTNWFTSAPYQVVNDHPLLAGTGLSVGSIFGRTGYNGAASGLEFDTLLGHDGEARRDEVIAKGLNGGDAGATMVMAHRPGAGWVFSASSIAFNGALDHDPALGRLLRNVFTLAGMAAPPWQRRHATVRVTAPIPRQFEDAQP